MASRNRRRKQSPKPSDPVGKQDFRAEQQAERQIVSMQAEFRGPLPPPEILQRYEEIHPGTAERVLQQFERETQHRHAIEKKIVDTQLEAQRAEIPALRLGQAFGLVIALGGILAGTICIILAPTAGHAWAGASIAGSSLATLVGVFIYGRKSKPATDESEKQHEQ